jgi:RNA polymerase sigma-70 factor (ECF subfamily)
VGVTNQPLKRYKGEAPLRELVCLIRQKGGTRLSTRGRNYADLSDEQLAELSGREPAAFAELYERYVDQVYTYIYYRSNDHSLTEDVVSASFLQALNRVGKFRSRGGGFRAWLLRIAHNQMIDAYRARRKVVALPETLQLEADDGPEQAAIKQDEAAWLRQLIAQLPDAQREVIILKYSLGMKNQEIAAITGRSPTAVSSLQYRALENLRKWGEVR